MVDDTSRAESDPAQTEQREEASQQFVVIRLGREFYGIPTEKTREVAKPLKITRIPGTPSHIMGLMNLRGEILCIVDVKVLLNVGEILPTESSKIVVIKTREGPVGVFCDDIIDIYTIQKKNIEAPLFTFSSQFGGCIKGEIQTRDGLLGILDIEELLFRQEK